MAGYTPVFDSVYAGTLCGRWPTTAVWVTLLPLCDKHGHIDLSYHAICALTGWPIELLRQGIADLMQPDPDSRSNAEEGRRLALLDPQNRNWGWRVVNHSLYREKARKMAYDSERTASGRDAERKRQSRDVPRCPDATRDVPLSDSNADSNSNKKSGVSDTSSGGVGGDASRKRAAEQRGSRIPTPFLVTAEMRKWAGEKAPHVNLEAATEDFCNYWRALPGQRSRKLDWVMTWKNRMKECEDKAMRSNGRAPPRELIGDTIARLNREADEAGEPRL